MVGGIGNDVMDRGEGEDKIFDGRWRRTGLNLLSRRASTIAALAPGWRASAMVAA
jgi:hypothetical protein